MDIENTMFLRIEAYLEDQMSTSERTAFEQEMEQDTTLAEEVSLQRDTHALLKLQAQTAYKEILQAYDKELKKEEEKGAAIVPLRPLWKQTWFRVAAAVVFLLVAGYTLAYFRLNSKTIAEDNFIAYSNITQVRHPDQQLDGFIQMGLEAYAAQDYQTAISWLSQVPPDSEQPTLQLYLGISYLLNGQGELAKQTFQTLSEQDTLLHQTAEWYLIYSLLQLGETAEAEQQLEAMIMADPPHDFQYRAIQLSERLGHPLRRWLAIP